MARQYITKTTIKNLLKARKEAQSYTRKLYACTWLLELISVAAGLERNELFFGTEHSRKEALNTLLNKNISNSYEGVQIPAYFFYDGKPFSDRPDLIQTSWTHGLNLFSCPDVNALAKFAINLPNTRLEEKEKREREYQEFWAEIRATR